MSKARKLTKCTYEEDLRGHEDFLKPLSVTEEPDDVRRVRSWESCPVDALQDTPPTVEQEPLDSCRWCWYARVPKRKLQRTPPRKSVEPDFNCRFQWWYRVDNDYLPPELPLFIDEPDPEVRSIAQARIDGWDPDSFELKKENNNA